MRHYTSRFFIGPPTEEYWYRAKFDRMWKRPAKGSRTHKRRHRAHLVWRAQVDGRFNRALYNRAVKVLPLP